jgi:hypothetical protein
MSPVPERKRIDPQNPIRFLRGLEQRVNKTQTDRVAVAEMNDIPF